MPAPAQFLLMPVGSSGDVHPFIGLGMALRQRGHAVSVAVNEHFADLVCAAGLEHIPTGVNKDYQRIIQDPDLWHPRRGFNAVIEHGVKPSLRPLYNIVAQRAGEGRTIVVTGALGLGARIARDKMDFPLVTVHLQPAVLRSFTDPPRLPGAFMRPGLPAWLNRAGYRLADIVVDRIVGKPINDFRREVGLPPVKRVMDGWWHSPDLVLGMFPDWFAAPQPQWPANLVLTGFPLFDERGVTAMPAGLEEFLSQGDPPIVFTPGSAMAQGQVFFAESVAAAQHLGRRALLLTKFPEQLPPRLPDGVRHFDYAPLSLVLPRAAALVFHGGIGTMAQGMVAGVPLLVMPMSHDQFDNALRITRLGIGEAISRPTYRAAAVAGALDRLLASAQVAQSCRELAGRLRGANPLTKACETLESLAARRLGQLG